MIFKKLQNYEFWKSKVPKKGPFMSTDGQTDRRSRPITRPAFPKTKQVKIRLFTRTVCLLFLPFNVTENPSFKMPDGSH